MQIGILKDKSRTFEESYNPELTAAIVSVKVALSLRKELPVPISSEFFWTDSQVVLAYISSETKRFHVYVGNQGQFIRQHSQLYQWMYVPSKENPADDISRGLNLSTTPKNYRWINGPEFLYKHETNWQSQ